MKITIERYNEVKRKDWNEFIVNSINGNFLHTRDFYNHNPLNEKDDFSFLFYKKNKIVGVLPAIIYLKDNQLVLHSHLRATYGGFIVNEEVGIEEAIEMVDLVITESKKNNVNEIIVRNPFRIFNKRLCDETDYAMWYHGFQIKSRELEIVIELFGDLTEIKKRYENGTKYNIKKAIKEVDCLISEDYETFWNILEKNLAEKYEKKPVHNLEEFYLLKEKVGADKLKLFAGYKDEKLISGVLTFIFADVIHAQYIGSDTNYQEIRPLNAVIDFIIDWGNSNGYKYFNLGTANDENGRVVNYGLFHFKEGFGGRGVLRETLSLEIDRN